MGTRTSRGAGGSAAGKPTDLTAKKGDGHRIERNPNDETAPVKAGRNMGGRGLMGERTRPTTRKTNKYK